MSVVVAVGVGASGAGAAAAVGAGMAAVAELGVVCGESDRFENPAWGGVTWAPFVNAVVLVQTTQPLSSLLMALFAIERRAGRVRGQRNDARSLDLDILWTSALPTSSSSSLLSPTVPHPRLHERAFCVRPLVQAFARAQMVTPLPLLQAAATLTLTTPMRAV